MALKAFYDKVYRIYDDRKISDTVLLFRMTVTVIIILSCLAVMTFVGYAYYEYELIIKINTIQSATFEVNVTVADNACEKIRKIPPLFYRISVLRRNEDKNLVFVLLRHHHLE